MSMDSKDELVIPLRIDTSQVAEDLRTIDPEIKRAEQRVTRAYNLSDAVKRGRAPRAESLEEVRTHLSGMSASDMRATLLGMQRPMGALSARIAQLEQAAKRGQTTLPATPEQAAKRAAQARLTAVGQQQQNQNPTKPVLTRFDSQSADVFARAFFRNFTSASRATSGVGGAMSTARFLLQAAGPEDLAGLAGVAGLGGSLGLLGAGVGVGAGLLVAGNQNTTQFNRATAALASALVGGPTFGSSRALMGLAINAAGQGLDFNSKTSQSIAAQLAMAGVKRGDILGNLSNTLMLSGPNAIDPNQIVGLTSSLATAGGLNNRQVNRVFQDVGNVAGDAGVSIQELIQSMTDLSKGATSAARDVSSLGAIQRILGPSSGILAGALMQPVMSSTGSQALEQAGILGMSPTAFLQAQTSQGGMASIFDRIAGLVKRTDVGPSGLFATESILQSTGLLNTQNLSPQQIATMLTQMKNATPQQAEKLAGKLYTQASHQATSQADSYKKAAAAIDNLTTWTDRLSTAFQNFITNFLNAPNRYSSSPRTQAEGLMGQTTTGHPPTLTDYSARAVQYMMTGQGIPGAAGISLTKADGRRVTITAQQLTDMRQASRMSGVPLGILAEQAVAETGDLPGHAGMLDPTARSSAGALGLGQFMPATIKDLASNPTYGLPINTFFKHFDPMNQKQAIEGMALYDSLLYGQYQSYPQALNAYNTGHPNTGYGTAVYNQDQNITVTVRVIDQNGRTMQPDTTHRVRTGAKHHGPPPPYHPRRTMRR